MRAGRSPAPSPARLRALPSTTSTRATILEKGRWHLSGVPAKFIWAFIHVLYLSGFENRLLVLLEWIWAMLTRRRGARLIEDPSYSQLAAAMAPRAGPTSPASRTAV